MYDHIYIYIGIHLFYSVLCGAPEQMRAKRRERSYLCSAAGTPAIQLFIQTSGRLAHLQWHPPPHTSEGRTHTHTHTHTHKQACTHTHRLCTHTQKHYPVTEIKGPDKNDRKESLLFPLHLIESETLKPFDGAHIKRHTNHITQLLAKTSFTVFHNLICSCSH